MRPIGSRLRGLLDAEQAALTALSRLADVVMVPEARTCLDELHYATTWFCTGLEKHLPRAARRRSAGDAGAASSLADGVMAAPAVVDQLRLVNRSQRFVLARIDGLLVESLDPELRALLTGARAILARSVRCCDDAIAVLDRARELRREPDA